jgi:hypothetical protein
MADYIFSVAVSNDGSPVTGLTLTDFDVNVRRRAKSGGALSDAITVDSDMTVEVGRGHYAFVMTGGEEPDFSAYDYFATVEYGGASTVDNSIWFGQLEEKVYEGVTRYDPPTKTELDQALSTTQSNLQDGSETLQTIYDRLGVILNGGGANEITITVNDGDSNPVSSVNVEIRDSGGNYKTSGDTNGSGIYNKARLDDGTYNVYLSKDLYDTSNPYTLTVSGDTATTFVITAVSVDPPASPENCKIYEYISKQKDGTYPAEAPTAWARIVNLPYDYAGKLHMGDKVTPTYDSQDGQLYWEIVKLASVEFYIEDVYSRQGAKTVPDQSTKRLADL